MTSPILQIIPGPFQQKYPGPAAANLETLVSLLPLAGFWLWQGYLTVWPALGILVSGLPALWRFRIWRDLDWLSVGLALILLGPNPGPLPALVTGLVASLTSLKPGWIRHPFLPAALAGLIVQQFFPADSQVTMVAILFLIPAAFVQLLRSRIYPLSLILWPLWACFSLIYGSPAWSTLFWWFILVFHSLNSVWPEEHPFLTFLFLFLIGLSPLFLSNHLEPAIFLTIILELCQSCSRRTRMRHLPLRPAITPTARPEFKAVLLCHRLEVKKLADFKGPASCRLLKALDSGPWACQETCLGQGDCVRVCKYGALELNSIGQLPTLRPELCQGCGLCQTACPQKIMVLRSRNLRVFIPCLGSAKMKQMDRLCSVGCLGCGLCRKACPAGAISRPTPKAPPEIDHELCLAFGESCQMACFKTCPRHLPASP